jgi:hypothetical protein
MIVGMANVPQAADNEQHNCGPNFALYIYIKNFEYECNQGSSKNTAFL